MTNRISPILAALEAEAATYEVLAIGEKTTRLCRTHSYFDAACEADEMVRGLLPLPVDGVEYLVVLSPNGGQCGQRFPVKRAKEAVPTEPPAPFLADFLLCFGWCCVLAGAGYGAFWLMGQ